MLFKRCGIEKSLEEMSCLIVDGKKEMTRSYIGGLFDVAYIPRARHSAHVSFKPSAVRHVGPQKVSIMLPVKSAICNVCLS